MWHIADSYAFRGHRPWTELDYEIDIFFEFRLPTVRTVRI